MRKLILTVSIAACFGIAIAASNPRLLNVFVGQKPELALRLPEGWRASAGSVKTDIESPKIEVHIQLWNVANAKTVAQAIPMVPEFIKGEVTEFKSVAARDIQVAGERGEHMVGSGLEADDGDPSNAEVFLFRVSGKVFLICAHGEGAGAAKARASILQMLATASPK